MWMTYQEAEARSKQEGRGTRRGADWRRDDLARTAARTQAHAGQDGKEARDHPGQCFTPRKAERSLAVHASEDRRGHGWEPVPCCRVPRPWAGYPVRDCRG